MRILARKRIIQRRFESDVPIIFSASQFHPLSVWTDGGIESIARDLQACSVLVVSGGNIMSSERWKSRLARCVLILALGSSGCCSSTAYCPYYGGCGARFFAFPHVHYGNGSYVTYPRYRSQDILNQDRQYVRRADRSSEQMPATYQPTPVTYQTNQ